MDVRITWTTVQAAALSLLLSGCQTIGQGDGHVSCWDPASPDAVTRQRSESESREPAAPSDAHLPSDSPSQDPVHDANEGPAGTLPALEVLAEPDKELTLEQLEQIAFENNPALGESRAHVEAARGKWVQVGLLPNTRVGYSGQQLGSGGAAEQHGLYLNQEFVRGGKLDLNRAVAAQEIAQAEQRLAAQQQRVQTDVRLGYYDVLIAQRRREVSEKLVQIAAEAAQTAEALLAAKEVSGVDALRSHVELQSAQLQLKNARNIYTAAWSRLAAVLGRPDLAPRPLAGDLDGVMIEIDREAALERLINQSPEIGAALAEIARANWALERAQVEPVPNVDVQAIAQSDNGTGGSDIALQVSLPIPWLNRNQGGIRAAQAEIIAAERAVGRIELGLQQRLATVFQRYASARNQVQDYSKPDGILDLSGRTLELVRKGYEAGEFGYLDLLAAQRTYSQTNLAYVEALGELWAAGIEIDGLLLKGSLE